MEVEEVQQEAAAASKYCKLNSGGPCRAMNANGNGNGTGGGDMVGLGRQWQNSSRIIRVSRASGGKDRHSKVWTAKGARDRRVRLSVNTAIQFYDLQDRLGYDQPSKAVEWLINAAADSINELPSLNNANFPPLTSERGSLKFDDSAHEQQQQEQQQQQQQMGSVSMSSSNNSETSKGSGGGGGGGSGLSLSRNEIRVKARERARERTAKDKDNNNNNCNTDKNPSSSFTQLLTAGINSNMKENVSVPVKNDDDLTGLQWSSSLRPMALLPFTPSHDLQQQQHQQQQLPFFPDNSLNFSIPSSSTTSGGFNRGTLQSNSSSSPSFLSYLQRFSSSDSGSSVPFFLGGAPVVDHQHQHYHHEHQPHPFNPAGLHLSYGNGSRHSEDKGKGKN